MRQSTPNRADGWRHDDPHAVNGYGHTAFFLWEGFEHDGLRHWNESTAAHTLQNAHSNHPLQRARQTAQHRGCHKS
jgi:hypothetical protein